MRYSISFAIAMLIVACNQLPVTSQIETASEQSSFLVSKSETTPAFRSATEMVAAGFKRYGVEQGIISFKLEGAVKGTEILYFNNWGWREAKYINTETEVGSFREKVAMIQFLDGESRYDYNPENKEAYLFQSPQVQRSADKYKTKDMVAVGIELMKNMGGVFTGIGWVAEVECEIWKLERYNTTLYMWHGLALKEESSVSNMPIHKTAILVKTNENPPPDKLMLPTAATILRK